VTAPGWRLLLTRPREECAALARTLAARGVQGSCLPLLEIEALPETPARRQPILDLDRYAAVIVVSKPAARLVLDTVDRYWPQPPAGQHWFAVGAATAGLLADYGLTVHWPPEGDDSEALLALPTLAESLAGPDARALIVRGEGGRGLLAERLRERGVAVDYLELYRRRLPEYPPGLLAQRVQAERLNGLVVSSGQGFEHLRLLAGDAWPAMSAMPLFVPSPRVAEQARAAGARRVVDCRGASAAALLEALDGAVAPAP